MILNNASDIRLGDTAVSRVYCGDTLVWYRNESDLAVLPTGYTLGDTFELDRYAINTGLQPYSGSLTLDTHFKIVKSLYTAAGYYDVILGGQLSDPTRRYDESPSDGDLQIGFDRESGTDKFFTRVFTNSRWYSHSLTTATASVTEGQTHTLNVTVTPVNITISIDGGTATSQQWDNNAGAPARDVWIGSNGNPANAYEYLGKLTSHIQYEYVKLYDSGQLKRWLVPVKDENDVISVYDYCTRQFYTPETINT